MLEITSDLENLPSGHPARQLYANMVKAQIPAVTSKPWGHERVVVSYDKYTIKELYVRNGSSMPPQFNAKDIKTFFLITGEVFLYLEGNAESLEMRHLTPYYIEQNTYYQFNSLKDYLLLEVSKV